jgi:hypothetical protein
MTVSTLIEAAQQESMTMVTGLFHKLVPQYCPTCYGPVKETPAEPKAAMVRQSEVKV